MRYEPGKFDDLVDPVIVEMAMKLTAHGSDVATEAEKQFRRYLRKQRRIAREARAAIARGILLCEFSSYNDWVIHARSWLGGVSGGGYRYKRRERYVCVDAKNRLCMIGADFTRARDDGAFPGAFPVRAYGLGPGYDGIEDALNGRR